MGAFDNGKEEPSEIYGSEEFRLSADEHGPILEWKGAADSWVDIEEYELANWMAENFIPKPKFMPGDECWWCPGVDGPYLCLVVACDMSAEGYAYRVECESGFELNFVLLDELKGPEDLYATEAEALEGIPCDVRTICNGKDPRTGKPVKGD